MEQRPHRRNNIIIAIGILFIVTAVLLNKWTFTWLFPASSISRLFIFKFILLVIDTLCILIGFWLIRQSRNIKIQNIIVPLVTFVICFLIAEAAYRIFDPVPYFNDMETSKAEDSSIFQYDPILGWKGVPNVKENFVTVFSKTFIQHNQYGFRDIDHKESGNKRDAIVFLGDSFTWGYGVSSDEMFVNIIREKLKGYEIFNLSQCGYGTDQELIMFRQWYCKDRLRLVILMFCENDFSDNISIYWMKRFKPRFELINNKLTLSHVPIPADGASNRHKDIEKHPFSFNSQLAYLGHAVFNKSHVINDLYFRLKNLAGTDASAIGQDNDIEEGVGTYILTKCIIRELDEETRRLGGELIVIAIPSKKQFMKGNGYIPYQLNLQKICNSLDITYLDMAPYFKKAFFRTYFRVDPHWNRYGNRIAAKAIYGYLPEEMAGYSKKGI